MMKKLIALRPVLYLSHQYEAGEELPASDATMVDAWLEAESAKWEEDAQEAKKAPKAKAAAATAGVTGLSSDGDPEAMAGRITTTPERETPKPKRKAPAAKKA